MGDGTRQDPDNDDVVTTMTPADEASETPGTLASLFESIYQDVRAMAGNAMRGERPGHTLPPTAVANEVYLRLAKQGDVQWRGRAHMLAVAGQFTRRILVDHARYGSRHKRGGGKRPLPLDTRILVEPGRSIDILALSDVLDRLAEIEPLEAQIVEARYFAGQSDREIAEAFGLSERSVRRYWTHAKAWLARELC